MRKNRSRLTMKIGLFKPTCNLKDFQILFFFSIYRKNHSRLTSKIGLSNHKRNLKDF